MCDQEWYPWSARDSSHALPPIATGRAHTTSSRLASDYLDVLAEREVPLAELVLGGSAPVTLEEKAPATQEEEEEEAEEEEEEEEEEAAAAEEEEEAAEPLSDATPAEPAPAPAGESDDLDLDDDDLDLGAEDEGDGDDVDLVGVPEGVSEPCPPPW